MLYFRTRELAREFSKKREHYQFVDRGTDVDQRWAVKVLRG